MSLAPTYGTPDGGTDAVLPAATAAAAQMAGPVALSALKPGQGGRILRVGVHANHRPDAIAADELERRLLEIGFVEGARVRVLHEGLIRRDPIAVRVDDMRVALRRAEARGILVIPD